MISLYQEKMEDERKILDKLYKHFSRKFNLSRKAKGPVLDPDITEEFFRRGIIVFLIIVVVLSAILIFYNIKVIG